MLDTVLAIGDKLRNSKIGFDYHFNIRKITITKEEPICLNLPVKLDLSLDLNNITEIPSDYEKMKLKYLTFRTSTQDTSIKYIFGDIYYGKEKNGNAFGNYRIKKNAFEKGERYIQNTNNEILKIFRKNFSKKKLEIERILENYENLFLHFDFEGKHWYELDVMHELDEILMKNFTEKISYNDKDSYVFNKMLYKTLCSGDEKNDIQFPFLIKNNRFKARMFEEEEVKNLFYANSYIKNSLIKIPKSNIKIIVLPRGENLTSKDYDEFINKRYYIEQEMKKEEYLRQASQVGEEESLDNLFKDVIKDQNNKIIQFDFIFSKQGGQSSPDTDLIELAGIEKSFINYLSERVRKISSKIYRQRKNELGITNLYNFNISNSFLNILGDNSQDKIKYQNHLYKVLPLIYAGNYYNDSTLLPYFIDKVEQNIRNDNENYNFLKYDLYFLTKIHNNKAEGENLMKIFESPSYHLGLKLGKMAQPLAKNVIRSFEKNYAGNITRRVTSIPELIKIHNDIIQKLIMHEKMYPNIQKTSQELTNSIKKFEEKFDRNEFALGFFENYFKYFGYGNKEENGNQFEEN